MLKSVALSELRAALNDDGDVWDDDELNFVLDSALAQVNQVRPESVVEEISLVRNTSDYTLVEPHTVTRVDWIDPAGKVRHELPSAAWELQGTNEEEAQTLYVGRLWQKTGWKARVHGWRPWDWTEVITPTCEGFDESPVEILFKFRWSEPDDGFASVTLMMELLPVSGSKLDSAYQFFSIDTTYPDEELNGIFLDSRGTSSVTNVDGSHVSGEWHWGRWQISPTDEKYKVWKDGEAEPDWLYEGSTSGHFDPTNYQAIQVYMEGDVDEGYIEIASLSIVGGFAHGTEEDTFSRTETDSWGTSEIFDNEWTPYLSNAVGYSVVDGAARYTPSAGGSSAKTMQLTIDCDPVDDCEYFNRTIAAGWGSSSFGLWKDDATPTSHMSPSVDGTHAILTNPDHDVNSDPPRTLYVNRSLPLPIEILMDVEWLGLDPFVGWSVAATSSGSFSEATISLGLFNSGGNTGMQFGLSLTNPNSVPYYLTEDARGISTTDETVELADFPLHPFPLSTQNIKFFVRLYIDEFGVYYRIWNQTEDEPLTGVTPSVGGKGEAWHSYRINTSGYDDTFTSLYAGTGEGLGRATLKINQICINP